MTIIIQIFQSLHRHLLSLYLLSALVSACGPKNPNKIKVGQSTYVCLVVASVDWNSPLAYTPTSMPSDQPSALPTEPFLDPTADPSGSLTAEPSESPTLEPSELNETYVPSEMPSIAPFTSSPSYTTGIYRRVSAQFEADKLSRFSIKNSWTSSNYSEDRMLTAFQITPSSTSTAGLAVSVQSNGVISYQKLFRTQLYPNTSDSYGITFPLLMAIVHVSKGVVESVTWDDTCKWCTTDSSSCAENTYDYRGLVRRNDGKNCFVRDSSCSVAQSAFNGTVSNSTLTNSTVTVSPTSAPLITAGLNFTSSCQLNVRIS
jgi:hypothetical protein